MYLNRCEVVEFTHLGHYMVRQRATMNMWVPRKSGNSVTRWQSTSIWRALSFVDCVSVLSCYKLHVSITYVRT